jgi:histidinol-phosphate aminotransferase
MSSSILDLARADLRSLQPYVPGAYEADTIRLNANESPWRGPGDHTERGLNRYPPPRPLALRQRLSEFYGFAPEQLLVTRGSSEAIDVLIRGFCEPFRDRILICPPTFDMYRLYANLQAAEVVGVPLRRDDNFALDAEGVLAALDRGTKVIFLCSPNNPTGASMPRARVERICEASAGRALVVIDEAYREFAELPDFGDLPSRFPHVVLLRTLSKCVALAGVRCGVLIGHPDLVRFLENVLPPYTFPTPSIELVMQALSEEALSISLERVALIRRERRRLSLALADLPQIQRVWPSDANFILVQAQDAESLLQTARQARILLRYFPNDPALRDCVRITVGRPEDNDLLLKKLAGISTDVP